jgi:hypothetical protein
MKIEQSQLLQILNELAWYLCDYNINQQSIVQTSQAIEGKLLF